MLNQPEILIVDDDREVRDLLSRFLSNSGYRTLAAKDGKEMRRCMADRRVDLVVLDLMLPGEDGLTLCRDLRSKSAVPVIMLTAKGAQTDRIVGLEMGADDYLPKPFDPHELLARIKAVLRRTHGIASHDRAARATTFSFAGWTVDLTRRRVQSPEDMRIDLTASEFDLLVAFLERPQRVLSREQLLDLTRGRDAAPFDRAIDNLVVRLRRKIEVDPTQPSLIKTIRGGGYYFAATVVRHEAMAAG
jgi:two-component system OmpR family response regulator